MNPVFCFGTSSHPSHNKNRKVLIMRLLKVFLGKVRKPFFSSERRVSSYLLSMLLTTSNLFAEGKIDRFFLRRYSLSFGNAKPFPCFPREKKGFSPCRT